MTAQAALIIAIASVGGWGDRRSLIVPGGDPARGVLVNLTPGAAPEQRPDPARPNVIFVHGFNPFPRSLHFHMAEHLAQSLARRGGPPLNIFSWDWNAATFAGLRSRDNTDAAIEQGQILAATLKASTIDPARTHLIGHSAGGIVVTSAAHTLAFAYGQPVAQLTLLDPAELYHEVIFDQLAAGQTAPIVENFWAPGLSGYGRPATSAGVRNTQVNGPHPNFGVVWPTRSNHLFIVHWYLDSALDPSYPSGFNTSIVLRPARVQSQGVAAQPVRRSVSNVKPNAKDGTENRSAAASRATPRK